MFFYKGNVVYPFVNVEIRKDNYLISDIDFCDVINYAEQSGMSILLIFDDFCLQFIIVHITLLYHFYCSYFSMKFFIVYVCIA